MHIPAMKQIRTTLAGIAGVAALGLSLPAPAAVVISGPIVNLFADPDDFVLDLGKPGPCGSPFFHVRRANLNFKEMVAVAMTAFAGGKSVSLFVVSCVSDRNIISHGAASR